MPDEEATTPGDPADSEQTPAMDIADFAQVDPAPPQTPVVDVLPAASEPYTHWGPPGAGRYLIAFLILIGITAVGLAVIWVLWGRQLWETFTGDWT